MSINNPEDRPDQMLIRAIEKGVNKHKTRKEIRKESLAVSEESVTSSTHVDKEINMETQNPSSLFNPNVQIQESSVEEKPVNLERDRNRCAIYACGGMSANITKLLHEYFSRFDKDSRGLADIEFNLIDTSASNLSGINEDMNVYLIPNKDGSGQKRALNASSSNERVKEIVRNFRPANLNIVMSSASGGSGSVLSPLVARELVKSKCPTVVILVGDKTTRKFAENTVATLKSFEAFTRGVDSPPYIVAYFENENNASRRIVDNKIINLVEALLVLFSGVNEELDSQDLFHWLNYHEVTDARVQLSNLVLVHGNNPVDEDTYGGTIAVATIAGSYQYSDFNGITDYQCIGIVPSSIEALKESALHFVITDGYFDKVISNLEKEISAIDETKNARVSRSSLVDKNTEIDDETGLVF